MSISLSSKKADLAHIEDAMQTMELGSRKEERTGLTEADTTLKEGRVDKEETRINISPKLEPCFPLTNTSNLYFGPKVIPAPDRTQEEKDQYEAGVPLPRNEESTVSILDSKFFINTDTIKIKRTSEFNEDKPFEGIKLSLNYNSLISCKWKLFWGYTEEEFRKQMYPLGEKLDSCDEGHIQRRYMEVDGDPGINKEFTIDNLGDYLEGLFRKDGEFLIRPPEPIADGLRSSFERKLVETWTRTNNDDSGNPRRRSNLRLTVAIPKPDRAPPPPRIWFPLIIHLTSNELCEGDKAKLNKTTNSITIYIDITTDESRRIDDLPGGREKTDYNPNEDIEAKNLIFEVQHLKTKVTINGNNFVVNPIFGYDTLVEKTLESNTEASTDSNFIPIKKDETNAGLTECVICLEAKCNTAILPCRHLCLCYDCSIELNTQTRRCPICRQDVDALLHIDIHQADSIGAFSNVKAQVCK